MTYRCPLCEDYDAPNIGAVKAHITGAGGDDQPDNPHSGESGPEYTEEQLRAGSDDGTADDDAEQADDAGDDVQDSADQSPADSGAESTAQTDAQPSQQDASTDGGSGIVPDSDRVDDGAAGNATTACPECDSEERITVDAYLEQHGDQLPDDLREQAAEYEYVCMACGACYDDD